MQNIVFEDDYILVVSKPFGILTQKDKNNSEENLYNMVSNYLGKDIGLINRLDRGVGGLVLFSKTEDSSKFLTNAMQNKKIEKTYLAVASGECKEKDYLENWLLKTQRLNISKVVCKNNSGSKKAILSYEKIASKSIENKIYSLLKINLETGRHHQIRCQLANQNIFIYGDKKYSNHKERARGYLGLLSYKLSFPHPKTNDIVSFKASPFNNENIFSYFKEEINNL